MPTSTPRSVQAEREGQAMEAGPAPAETAAVATPARVGDPAPPAGRSTTLAGGRILGREDELRTIASFVEEVRSSGLRLLLIDGVPGIGKSTLWAALGDRAERQGAVVWRSRPSMHETTMAFAGLVDLMAPIEAPVFERLFPPQRRALEAALLRRDPDGRSLDRRAVSAAFLSVVQATASAGPVLIAVDDAQWLDLPTIRVLEFALRRLDRAPVGIAIARRSGDDGRTASLVTAVDERHRVRISLGPLPAPDIEALIAAESGSRLRRNVIRAIGRASDGNPMLAREMAGELARSGPPTRGEPLPLIAPLSPC